MNKSIGLGAVMLIGLLVACGTPVTPKAVAVLPTPAIVSPSGYRPIQTGDEVEGVTIGYQFILPSIERPVVVIAASAYLLHFITVKAELVDGLVSYIQSLPKDKSIYAFDENDPKQTEPKLMTWDATKPVEIVFIPLPEDKRSWSVTEGDGAIEAAYKIIRRKDGGLRVVDAYGKNAIYSAGELPTINGTGMGLMFSARLALLKMILDDPRYQRGANVMTTFPPDYGQYDARVLVLDPSKEGTFINRDWVLVTRPGPNPGLAAP